MWTTEIGCARVPPPMMSRRRTLPAWLAIIALSLHALWPLIAQARPKMPGMLIHICAMDGRSQFIELALDGSPLEKRSAAQHEHCSMCVLSGDRLAVLPPAPIASMAVPFAASEAPVASAGAAPPRSHSHPPAYPRAPPAAC